MSLSSRVEANAVVLRMEPCVALATFSCALPVPAGGVGGPVTSCPGLPSAVLSSANDQLPGWAVSTTTVEYVEHENVRGTAADIVKRQAPTVLVRPAIAAVAGTTRGAPAPGTRRC